MHNIEWWDMKLKARWNNNNIMEGTKRQKKRGDKWRKKERSVRVKQWYHI